MDLDKNQDSGNTTHTPHTHTRGMDPTPDLPSLPPHPKKKCGDNMDRGPSSSISSPDTATHLPYRLHGLLANSLLERIPSSTQETHCFEICINLAEYQKNVSVLLLIILLKIIRLMLILLARFLNNCCAS